MKKILFIHHASGWGGAPINLINIINKIKKNKYAVEVLLLKDSVVAQKLKENNIPYSIVETNFYKKYYQYFSHSEAGYVKWYQLIRFFKVIFFWFLSRFYFANKVLSQKNADIVHLNSSTLSDWLAPAKRRHKVVMHIQEPFRKGKLGIIYSFLRRQMVLYADHLIAISKDNAKRINIPQKTSVIYNFSKDNSKNICAESYNSRLFLYLGGNAQIKGFYTLVESLDYLNQGIKIIFAGNYLKKENKNRFKSIIKKHLGFRREERHAIQKIKNHKNAVIKGLIFDIDRYYRECCCVISPFTVPHFSRPVIEAFLHKKPVIVSDVAGMEEIVTHNVNGLVFKAGDPIDLAKAINSLAANPDLAKKMGENGYKRAIEMFTDSNVQIIESIYDNLLTQ